MKLALGTVQLGLPYGINNAIGVPDSDEIRKIFSQACAAGIVTLDTAIDYGESELKIGKFSDCKFDIVTKLPAIKEDVGYSYEWLFDTIKKSLGRLNTDSIYGLLLHRPNQLMEEYGNDLYEGLLKLKDLGLVKKLGISIYDTKELDLLMGKFHFDIIQAPFNILDNRLISSGWLSRLDKLGVEIHVRSVFLQGLLLMHSDERPGKFKKWDSLWKKYDEWLSENKISMLEACIRYVCSFKEVKKVIVGIESQDQLDKILYALPGICPEIPEEFNQGDLELLNPGNWANLRDIK